MLKVYATGRRGAGVRDGDERCAAANGMRCCLSCPDRWRVRAGARERLLLETLRTLGKQRLRSYDG